MTEIKHSPFSEEQFKNTITGVIDGDGIAYAIAWNHKDDIFPEKCLESVDAFMHDTLQGIQARHYVGILSPGPNMVRDVWAEGPDGFELEPHEYKYQDVAKPNFRYAIATSKPYKGNRGEKPEWYDKWCPVIEAYLRDAWGFIHGPEGFEADDLCATMATLINSQGNCTVVHTDKDLKQIPGNHFNPKEKKLYHVTQHEAWRFLYHQIIMGDKTDNIEGIPGWGEKATDAEINAITQGAWERSFMLQCIKCYAAAYEQQGMTAAISKFWENYQLCKLITDMDISELDDDAIRGYDLDGYANINTALPEEQEDLPDFSPLE